MINLSQPVWICTLCGHTFAELAADSSANSFTKLSTEARSQSLASFENLADSWVCPDCSAAKAMFALCRCVCVGDYQPCAPEASPVEAQQAAGSIGARHSASGVGTASVLAEELRTWLQRLGGDVGRIYSNITGSGNS